jgi:predicted nucleotidyltransferase
MQAQLTRQEAIAEITRQLVEYYRPVRVYLFGSEARGDAGPDSDLDFLVVVPDDTSEEVMRSGEVYSRVAGLNVSRNIIPWRLEDFEIRASYVPTSLPATVVREGKLPL